MIENLGLTNGSITNTGSAGFNSIGLLVGYNQGSISNSYAKGSILNNDSSSGAEIVGGLVGSLTSGGAIITSYSDVSIANTSTGGTENLVWARRSHANR